MALKEVEVERKPGQKKSRGSAYRVLYVEDEDANWEVTKAKLDRFCEMYRARNSREAVALLNRDRFDLILMDIQLMDSPVDGIELTRRLRRGTAGVAEDRSEVVMETPIVFVTAYASRYSKDTLVNEGGDDMLTKPVDFVRLVATMNTLISQRVSRKVASMKRSAVNPSA